MSGDSSPLAEPPEAMSTASVLLLGAEAERLAARLAVSGYRSLTMAEVEKAGGPLPALVILAADQEAGIPGLRQRFPGVPLLLGIAADSLEGRVRTLASGADDFWITSLGPSDLLTRIRLHLGLRAAPRPLLQTGTGEEGPAAAESAPSPTLQVADLVLISATREVRRGARMLQLTTREYDLLLLLLGQSGTVVSREAILEAIWPEERPAASNVIEVYIRYLRQKLEEQGERRLIHTVRGQGYCLSERLPSRTGSPP